MTSPTPPVSGPGALSRRTDRSPAQKIRDLPNADYGENAIYTDIQRGAPLAASEGPEKSSVPDNPMDQVVPLGVPSQRPGESVMAGVNPLMTGPSLEDQQLDRDTLAAYVAALEFMANMPGSSSTSRNLVRKIKAQL